MNWPGGAEWLSFFAEHLIKTSFALSFALLLVSMFRGRQAAIRHFILAFFLITLLLLPFLSELQSGWETHLLPPRNSAAESTIPQTSIVPLETVMLSRSRSGPTSGLPNRSGLSEQRGFSAEAAPQPSTTTSPGMLEVSLPLIWSAGLAILLLRLGAGIFGAYRLTREGEEVADPLWRILLARFLAAVRIRKAVRLKTHGDVAVPLTWGLFRPVILIPPDHLDWTEAQRSSALLHELSHIKRADFPVMLLARLSLAVYWFNPLSWIVFRLIKREQERACDECVLTTGIKPSEYAATLLSFKRSAGAHCSASTAFLGLIGSGSFNDRLAAILRQKPTLKEVTMKTKIMLAIVVSLAVALIGMARPTMVPSEMPLNSPAAGAAALQTPGSPRESSMMRALAPEQEKKTETQAVQEKKKEEQKRAIVVKNKEGEVLPIEITVVTGGQDQRIKIDRPIMIKEGKEGELILVSREGKELPVLKGEPIRLAIKDKDLVIVQEGKPLPMTVVLGKEGEKLPAEIAVVMGDQARKLEVAHAITIRKNEKGELVLVGSEGRELEILKGEPIRLRVQGKDVILAKEGNVLKLAKVMTVDLVNKKDEEGAIHLMVAPRMKVQTTGEIVAKEVEIKEKVQALQEKLKKAQEEKLDLTEYRKAIREIVTELMKQKVQQQLVVEIGVKPRVFTVIKGKDDTREVGRIWIVKGTEENLIVGMTYDKRLSVSFTLGAGESSRAVYESTVEQTRKALPEGYTLEPEFNETSGAVTLNITGNATEGVSAETVKKLIGIIKEALKQIK